MASKANTSLSSELTTARLLAEGIKNRADSVAKVGLTADKAAEIEALLSKLTALDNQQEELKAQLKEKTAELDSVQKTLRSTVAETRKLVKIAVDKAGWVAFGISDKQ